MSDIAEASEPGGPVSKTSTAVNQRLVPGLMLGSPLSSIHPSSGG